jgi:hypothetical protein
VIVAIIDSEVASGPEEVAMEQVPLLIFTVFSLALNLSFLSVSSIISMYPPGL